MIFERKATWEEFKLFLSTQNHDPRWVYRGHGSEKWNLESTLYRFLQSNKPDSFLARKYHEVLKSVLSNQAVKNNPDFSKLILPQESPFFIGLLTGCESHLADMEAEFNVMVRLRHLGFPSPLFEWTKNASVAAFFAFANVTIENAAIWRAKIAPPNSILGSNTYSSEYNFPVPGSRHEKQESVYTIIVDQFENTAIALSKRQGPAFRLYYDHNFTLPNMEIEKFVITDSKLRRLEIFDELYEAGFSFEKLYGSTHILENTVLKNLANELLFFSEKRKRDNSGLSNCQNGGCLVTATGGVQ